MLYIAVLTAEPLSKNDVWPIIGQYPDLADKFSAFMNPESCNIHVDVRTSAAFDGLLLRPYMYAIKLTEGDVEFNYEHLPIIVLYNLTKEQHEIEHTKQRLAFQQPEVNKSLEAFLLDVQYSELEQHVTSTGNGLLVMRDIDPAELRDSFARGNRANFTVIEGTK